MANHYIKGNDTIRDAKSGTTVTVKNGNIERALRRFKKLCTEENIIREFRAKTEFVENTRKRRLAEAAGRNRWKKQQRENNQ
jgi:ribosomal protein S21